MAYPLPPWLDSDPLAVLSSAAQAGDRRAQLALAAQSQAQDNIIRQQQMAQEERQFNIGLQEGARKAAEQIAANFALARLSAEGEQAQTALRREMFEVGQAEEARKEQERKAALAALEKNISGGTPIRDAWLRAIPTIAPGAMGSALPDEPIKVPTDLPPGWQAVKVGNKVDLVPDKSFVPPESEKDKLEVEVLKERLADAKARVDTLGKAELEMLKNSPLYGVDEEADMAKVAEIVARSEARKNKPASGKPRFRLTESGFEPIN